MFAVRNTMGARQSVLLAVRQVTKRTAAAIATFSNTPASSTATTAAIATFSDTPASSVAAIFANSGELPRPDRPDPAASSYHCHGSWSCSQLSLPRDNKRVVS